MSSHQQFARTSVNDKTAIFEDGSSGNLSRTGVFSWTRLIIAHAYGFARNFRKRSVGYFQRSAERFRFSAHVKVTSPASFPRVITLLVTVHRAQTTYCSEAQGAIVFNVDSPS